MKQFHKIQNIDHSPAQAAYFRYHDNLNWSLINIIHQRFKLGSGSGFNGSGDFLLKGSSYMPSLFLGDIFEIDQLPFIILRQAANS